MAEYIVYGDINCPFSYALHEMLHSHNLMHRVDWRMVEHDAISNAYQGSAENMAELANNIFNIRNRAPDITISLPSTLGDSLFPSLCITATQQIDPDRAATFLRTLYRALWIKGKDIASPAVIYDALEEAGLPTELDIDGACEETLLCRQNEWEDSHLGLQTPVIQAEDGRRLVGFVNQQAIIDFMQGAEINQDLCSNPRPHSQMTIAIYGDEKITEIWSALATLRDESNILLPQSMQALQEMLLSQERCPDLILLNNSGHLQNLNEVCRGISHLIREQRVPIAVIGHPISDSEEAELYDLGISDYLIQTRDPVIIRARINILLQLKSAHDMLSKAASIDALTQVYNRREFERCFETEWRRGQRSRQPISVILLDIDHFKAFNDSFGHLEGDSCLQQVASTIQASARRAQDLVCRYGGEEFVILLPETNQEGARILAEKVRQKIIALNIQHAPAFANHPVSASLGVATAIPANRGLSPRQLLQEADNALYKAKHNGRNRVELFSP
ncbi:diguanylate cyclase [Amphritea sp.]|uniref:diguanylate cyclase n=1 Tax=Amphritea sp. TaxID=1872502 RepID=UPI003D0AD812